MRKVEKLEQKIPLIPSSKKVAAYARVSMESERLQHSLSVQISHYSELIQNHPGWEYAGVYADDGITGTKLNSREEFSRMIADCDAGKIDIILTKSISRFARNTVDLLNTVRHLKDLGISVQFEKEHIDSMTEDGELMLTLLASFAQEEIHSLSENVKWATRKRFEQGIPNGRFTIFGYRWEGDQLVIVPEEAEIVRRIYQDFLDGKSRLETERELAAEGITTRKGYRFVDSNLKVILTNITYTGNMLFNKEYTADPITKHRKKNKGELPQYFVADTHEPIIDMDTFQYVQNEMARRKALGALANKALNTTCFTGKIKCPHCGVSYMHNKRNDRGHQEFWNCGTNKDSRKRGRCTIGGCIPQKVLEAECAAVLGTPSFDEEAFQDRVDHIDVPEKNVMIFYLKDGTVMERHWISTAKRDMWTPERKAVWSEYNFAGGRKKTGMGFNEYMKWKEENDGTDGNNHSGNTEPIHGGSDQ